MSRHTTDGAGAVDGDLARETRHRSMTPRELGALLARSAPPLTDEQVEAAARILALVDEEAVA